MASGMNIEYIDKQINIGISDLLKKYRLEKGYSLEELANRINNIVSRQMLFKYETSKARIKVDIFNQICLALDKDPQDVWARACSRVFNIEDDTNYTSKEQLKKVLTSSGVLKESEEISDEDFDRIINFIENNRDLLIK